MTPKNTICVWYDADAEEAANFYASVFPGSEVKAVHISPADNPGNKEGDVITVEFTVCGVPCLGLNGGPAFKPNESVSFMVLTESQEETDRYWDAIIGHGGAENACGWCKDRWGYSWQITPRRLLELTTSSDRDVARLAFEAMMTMTRIDIAALEAAVVVQS